MKHGKISRTLALVLSLLILVMMSTPALAAPVITVSPVAGAVGTLVTVEGANFDSYMGDNVFIEFDSTEITTTPLVVPQTGTFTNSFSIPDDADPGRHWVRVRSELGAELASTLFIIPGTAIKLGTEAGSVGTVVAVTGEGFHANKTVTVYYNNRTKGKLGTEVATPTGELSYRFTIPSSTAGKHNITAEDTEGSVAEAEFEVIPLINLDSTSGAIGDLLTVSGTGFGYRSDVAVYFKDAVMAYTKTDSYGDFSGVVFNIPVAVTDTYDVRAEDAGGNMDKAEFTITIGASLDKSTGSIGTGLTVRGTGFVAGGTVTIKYDNMVMATVPTDANGTFESTFNVPVSKSGNRIITVSDEVSTKYLAFTVETDAPAKPVLLLPASASAVKAEAYFYWQNVYDSSPPVTYSLQVASDGNFASIVLEKEGLSDSGYSLVGDERLAAVKREAPYYWRVKAIDGADNEGEWSAPASFYIGYAMPGWAIYILIGLAVLLVILLAFWLGRRTAYYSET